MAEPYLGNPAKCSAVLKKYGFSFRKKYGQNFLINTGVLESIISTAGITKEDFVLEIGPGIGTLTQYLATYAGQVVAVEIDRTLIPILEDTLSEWDNVEILSADILKTDIRKIADEKNGGKPIKICANLPYYITTPILMALLESGAPISDLTVMVQKEVAERMVTGPGSKEYGALSLAVQYYTKPEISFIVPPSSFMPRPHVDSAVVHMELYREPPVKVIDEKMLFKVIRASFNERRKTLLNGLTHFQEFDYSREELASAIEQCGFPSNIRGENLTLEEFAKIADLLTRM